MYPAVRHCGAKDVFDNRPSVLTRGFATKNYSIDVHDHDFYEINIVLSGRGRHYIENKSVTAKAGDVFVIPPGVAHGYESLTQNFNVYHLIVKEAFFEKYSEDIKRFSGFTILFEIEPYLRMQNRKTFLTLDYDSLLYLKGDLELYSLLRENKAEEADVLRNVQTLKVIGYLCYKMSKRTLIAEDTDSQDYIAISKGIEYIHSNFSEKLTIDLLAEICNMSRATYIRKFKKVCNTTPNEYIIRYRCSLADKMLTLGKNKTEVAQECGFYDVSHMEKYLKQ